jgi:hypothetical protein
MKTLLPKVIFASLLLTLSFKAQSQIGWQIDQTDTAFLIDFDNTVTGVNNGQFAGTGFANEPTAGQIDTDAIIVTGMSDGDLSFGAINSSGDFGRGTSSGGVATGGVYGFEVSANNFALGVQPIESDFTPGDIILRLQNSTLETITEATLAYDILVLNDRPRSNSFNLSYSLDNINYTSISSLDFATIEPTDSSPVWKTSEKSTVISGLNLLPNAVMYLKWTSDDVSGSSNRDEIAIDNIEVSLNPASIDYVYSNSWTPQDPTGLSRLVDNIIITDGNAVVSGDIQSNNISIQSSSSLEVGASSSLRISGDLTIDGDLVFKSDASGSGQLIHALTSTITGDITVERFVPAKRAFRFLTSPVGGQTFADSWQLGTHITGVDGVTNGFDETTINNPSLFIYNNQIANPANGAGWEAVTSTNDVLIAGKPYRLFVRGDRTTDLTNNDAVPSPATLISKGNLLTGELISGVDLPALSEDPDHFSFVANPYQAVLDFSQVIKNGVTDFLYVWDAKIAGDNGNGGYVTIDLNSTVPSPSTSEANRYLIPGQGFFVQNQSTVTVPPTLVFAPSAIASDEVQPEILSNTEVAFLNMRLYKKQDFENGKMEADATGIRFSDDFTTPPSEEDAGKLFNSGEALVVYNEKILSIDNRKFPDPEKSIQLLIGNYKQSEYTLDFDVDFLSKDKELILIDNYLNKEIDVADGSFYNFLVDSSIEESIAQDRFELKIKPVTLSLGDFNLTESVRLYPIPAGPQLHIETKTTNTIKSIELYSMLGQRINSDYKANDKGIQLDVSVLSEGVYLVKVETEQGTTTKRFIKK